MLVDEFQDTDPVQWDIMRRAFGGGGVALILIGDPKQAIYAFRGADVYAYLKARSAASAEATLEVNWRSDQGLIDAYDAMFGGATLGHEGIVYRRVRAAPANQTPGLSGAPVGRGGARAGRAPRRAVDHAHEARRLREHAVGARAHRAGPRRRSRRRCCRRRRRSRSAPRDAPPRREPIRPGHVAVLVRTHRNAALVREALDAAGIPAVINGAGSVFGTVPARDWLRVAGGDRAAGRLDARAVGGADAVSRLDGGAGRVRGRAGVGGGPPPAASLGAGAARERRRGADGDDHARRGAARPRAGDGRRRARR